MDHPTCKLPNSCNYIFKRPSSKEAGMFNPFISEYNLILCKILLDFAMVKEMRKQGKVAPSTITYDKRSSLMPISESMANTALFQLYQGLSQIFNYFPMVTDMEEKSYLHIIRTEEIKQIMSKSQSREDFLQMIEKIGTIIVPIEWVFHKHKILLTDMSDSYAKITEVQISKDLQRDVVVINNVHRFENETSTPVLQKMAEVMIQQNIIKDQQLALQKALSGMNDISVTFFSFANLWKNQ